MSNRGRLPLSGGLMLKKLALHPFGTLQHFTGFQPHHVERMKRFHGFCSVAVLTASPRSGAVMTKHTKLTAGSRASVKSTILNV